MGGGCPEAPNGAGYHVAVVESEIALAKTLTCRDVGVDCDFVARGENDEDIMQQAAAHAKAAHGMDAIPQDLAQKARAAIRDDTFSSSSR